MTSASISYPLQLTIYASLIHADCQEKSITSDMQMILLLQQKAKKNSKPLDESERGE